MDRSLAIRRVRIAVSVFFGVLAVALCVLWVRSYWWADSLEVSTVRGRFVLFGSSIGNTTLDFLALATPREHLVELKSNSIAEIMATPGIGEITPELFPTNFLFTFNYIVVPHWFLILVCATSGIAPWLSRRFSLRTLLIATTFIAVVLGLAVWLTR